jgi:hypothetical protein
MTGLNCGGPCCYKHLTRMIMLKRYLGFLAITLAAGQLAALQKPKAEPVQKVVLTEEEKEILKNRELLENLELLQDFEKFRYFDLFASPGDPDAGKPKPETKQPKKDEKKKK